MGRGADGSRSPVDLLVEQWPSLLLVPAVLGLLAVLVAVTRWWDGQDAACAAGAPARPRTRTVAASLPLVLGNLRRGLRWRRRCACSWHTAPARTADRGGVVSSGAS